MTALGTLTSSTRLPKRAETKPRKREGKADSDSKASRSSVPGCILRVLPDQSNSSEEGHREKDGSRYFEPQLMDRATEGTQRRAGSAQGSVERAAAARLVAGQLRHNTELS